ncbi:hypothetical protein FHS04_000817 [Mesoflavibacter sabulilitoris]|uniref:Uncharacterized protein n=1 Tax=Mesoflavibacter zeaxanthinifaciens subsp. sabulilitoris TaxID=1520893 RepID=A0A2T1N679_9FLAO|nr:hypothetical protein [Mesoflavibacter zeaxanthinifaciens]MBB3123320.1 hypothetical protein [Mesoflavibacter zeaxanthinifaciens subsp. sabulilitoris]PSG87044.1 hypothetical protein C7H61_13115 [Mesoflavibacter zeaxanthinifaciens subsp. sabulilitoris]
MNLIKFLLRMIRKESYQIYTYRTIDGIAYFKFSYHWKNNGYEIDIHQQPSYEGRATDHHISHRLSCERDAPYKICISNLKLPKTLEAAQKFSVAFAEYTWEYIKTGVSIDTQISIQAENRQ